MTVSSNNTGGCKSARKANCYRHELLLDGFVSSGTGNEDWIFRSGDDATDDWVVAQLDQAGLIAMGSRSFGDMAQYWPTAESLFAAVMNATPKLVFSRSRAGAGERPGAEGG